MDSSPVILFDGVCNFCNGIVNFVIRNEKGSRIRFATMQSDAGRRLLIQYGYPADDLSSFVFLENGKLYNRSTAALKVSKYLKGLWPVMIGFIIVPVFIRDALYKYISKNRYKWFGKKEICMVPSPELSSRFLNDEK